MYYAVISALMFIAIIYFLLKGKCHPIVVLVLCPLAACILSGYGLSEIAEICGKGLNGVWKNGVLFIFSVMYFGIMSDAGMFDGMVAWLVKRAGTNVVLVTTATVLIGMVAHLDGSTATTALVTIPAMLPIYKKLKMDPKTLLLLLGVSMTIMNLTPWGGPTLRIATVLDMDVNELWMQIIPMQAIGLVITIAVGVIFGFIEKKKGAGQVLLSDTDRGGEDRAETCEDTAALKRPKLTIINWGLTLIMLISLMFSLAPAYIVFMVFFCIGITVNYPNLKVQQDRFAKHAPNALMVSATMISAGILVGVVENTEILNALVELLVGLVPAFAGPYLHLILACLAMPIGFFLGGDPFFYGFFPLVAAMGEKFGIDPVNMGIALLAGKNAVMIVAPVTPVTFLATGLADVPLKDHIKYSFKYLWIISLVFVAAGIVVGSIKI